MPIAQAGELLQNASASQAGSSAVPRIIRHQPDLDNQSLEQVAWHLQNKITPLVAIESLDSASWAGHPRHQSESLLCDITGVEHLFSGEAGLMRAVTEQLATIGLAARMAIADSVGAAWAVAHEAPARTSRNPEDRCFLVPQGGSRKFVEPLLVRCLRIPPSTVHTLGRLGIERVAHLLSLPRSGIAPRLGISLVQRIEQVLGEVDEPLGIYRPAAEHSETLSLEYATTDQNILADRIERLTKKVRAGLATRQRGALRTTCRLDLSAHPPLTLEVGLFAPTIDANHLSGLLIHRLESTRLPSSVIRVTVAVTQTAPLRCSQNLLFQELSSGKLSSGDFPNGSADALSSSTISGSSVSRLIDSLSGRLGRDAVVGVKLSKDPLPEEACQISPLAGRSTFTKRVTRRITKSSSGSVVVSGSSGSLEPSPCDAMRRPLSLLAHPKPLAVSLCADQHAPLPYDSFSFDVPSRQLPCAVRIDQVIHRLIRSWGPERIETGWWKGPSIGREYYRVETDRGQCWWIFRNLVPPSKTITESRSGASSCYRWHLHGHFA